MVVARRRADRVSRSRRVSSCSTTTRRRGARAGAAVLRVDAAGGLRHVRGRAAAGRRSATGCRTRRSPRRSAATSARRTAYRNGQSAELAPGLEDVAHEYGCRIEGAGAAREVRAWLFAPPVTRSRATDLVDEAAGRASCSRPAHGAGVRRSERRAGLSGRRPPLGVLPRPVRRRLARLQPGRSGDGSASEELLDRAGRWCVAVAEAAAVD